MSRSLWQCCATSTDVCQAAQHGMSALPSLLHSLPILQLVPAWLDMQVNMVHHIMRQADLS